MQVTKQMQSWESESSELEISIATVDTEAPVEDEVHDTLVGERFGKYLLVGELAVGGMAEVFLAVHRGPEGVQKVVVIKRVLPTYSGDPSFVQMFVDEARIAARLEHPNLIRTYEFGEVGGQYFTAMEYLPGEDLAKTLDRFVFAQQQMPLHLAASIVASVCAGLHFAHALTDTAGRPLSLIHRDINPANVIVTYTGEIKVIDFGIAKTTATETQSGTIKGKIAYMSPEQLLARGVDQRSDVFSTGVVLWELITGRPLFLRDNEGATLYAIMNEPIRAPSRLRPAVPRALDSIVMRALARTPADRYDTAEEMGLDLERFLEDQPKHDGRAAARMLEDLFGTTRAEAKRAIAQSRSLQRNVALVMKPRAASRSELVETLEPHPQPAVGPAPRRGLALGVALVLLLASVAGVAYFVLGGRGGSDAIAKPTAHPVLQVDSDPTSAAISINGEPTGLKTPATLTDLAAGRVTIRLERPGYRVVTDVIEVPRTGMIAKRFTLGPAGR